LTTEQALERLAGDPRFAALIRDCYWDDPVEDAAKRFAASPEFVEVKEVLAGRLSGCVALDLGAGRGIASYALLQAGARRVFAVEPDPSERVGCGAIRKLLEDGPASIFCTRGDRIPLDDASVDLVYARQVLHHIRDLGPALAECARVLKPGGPFLACREHVVDDKEQLRRFLEEQPLYAMTGDEHAHSLVAYHEAFRSAGLEVLSVWGPWDSVLNAWPFVGSREELGLRHRIYLARRFGPLGLALSCLPGMRRLCRWWLNKPRPGRLYSFLAGKLAR
jgi:SAM-dependent methyltransferase